MVGIRIRVSPEDYKQKTISISPLHLGIKYSDQTHLNCTSIGIMTARKKRWSRSFYS